MIFMHFPYIKIPEQSTVQNTAKSLFLDNGKADTYLHVCAVAEQAAIIAKHYDLNEEKCYLAGLLHDISCVIKPKDMLSYAVKQQWHLCEAERKFPFLLHQRLSADVAQDYFNITDHEILSAISCHTTLKANASAYDMALFVADKLAWDQDDTPPFYTSVKAGLAQSLEQASYAYMAHMTEHGRVLFPHENWTWAMAWLASRLPR